MLPSVDHNTITTLCYQKLMKYEAVKYIHTSYNS